MSELNASNLRKEHGNEGPDLVGLTELTSPYFMVPPSGSTVERPENPEKGTLRFNTDLGSLEFYRGDTIGWEQIVRTTPNLGGGTGSNKGTGVRGLHMGGFLNPGESDVIDYITISTLGNAIDFGNLLAGYRVQGGCASRTRGISAGGYTGSASSQIQYITISSTGDALDFGNLSQARYNNGGLSNQTRGIFYAGEGSPSWINVVDYITIAATGVAVDFGDIQNQNGQIGQNNGVSSPTRGIAGGGYVSPGAYVNIIGYVTIQTTGDFADFGDLTEARGRPGGIHNATRGIFTGGWTPSTTTTIDYITMATLGNAIDFGDQLYGAASLACCSSPTRGTAAGGWNQGTAPTYIINTIGYVEIATTGNLTDFGDLSVTRGQARGISNGHGGL